MDTHSVLGLVDVLIKDIIETRFDLFLGSMNLTIVFGNIELGTSNGILETWS